MRVVLLATFVVISGCTCTVGKPADGGTGGGFLFTGGGGGSSAGGGAGGGAQDAGATDAGAIDAGPVTDAGTTLDAGTMLDAGTTDAGTTTDAGAPDAGLDAGTPCTFTAAPADGTRRVIVSHPFPADGGSRDNLWELFTLSPTGALTANNVFFRMGRSTDGASPIVFTADGRFGYAAQEDGTIGIFRLDGATVTVVSAGHAGNFSAGKLVMQPSGNRLWVLDFNTQNNGGGVYTVDLACDGTLFNEQYVLPGNNAAAAVLLPTAQQLLVASRSLPGTPMMQDLHLLDVATTPAVVRTSTTGFPDRDAIAPTVFASRDERLVSMPDNGFAVGSRVAFFERVGNTLTAKQVVTTTNPVAVRFSPFADLGLVVNTDGADQFRKLTWNAAATTFTISAALPYVHGRPQLPSAPVMIERGALQGRLLIAELDAIRQLQFERDAGITDVAKTPAGLTGNAQILGTIGVTP